MDINTIQKLDRNSVIGQLNLLPVAELKIVNFYLRNGLVEIYRQNDKEKEDKVFRFIEMRELLIIMHQLRTI